MQMCKKIAQLTKVSRFPGGEAAPRSGLSRQPRLREGREGCASASGAGPPPAQCAGHLQRCPPVGGQLRDLPAHRGCLLWSLVALSVGYVVVGASPCDGSLFDFRVKNGDKTTTDLVVFG